VQEAVLRLEAYGELADELLAADLVADRGHAPDQLHEVEPVELQVGRRGVHHRLQGVAPGQRHRHRVLDVLEQQAGGLGADLVLDPQAGSRCRVGHAHVPEAERGAQVVLELVDAALRVVDPDLDDALLLRLGEHAGNVRATGAHELGDLRLRPAEHVVLACGDQQGGGIAGDRHSHLCASW
jgi:hypothetical protein